MSGLTKEHHLRMTIGDLEAEVARLTRERNAFMVGLVAVSVMPDDELVDVILGSPEKIATLVGGTIKRVIESGYEKYLDLPSDLGRTS